jgi:phosphocarrier protein HPr
MSTLEAPINPAGARSSAAPLRQTFVLRNRNGLHARPCVLLVKTLEAFHCRVNVECNGEMADASSVIGLLMLAAGYDSKLVFTVTGSDAAAAMKAIGKLFETGFREAYE